MYIKNKEVFNDRVHFECSPVLDTHRLVNRARAIVDDYFTFVNYDYMTENYNFRKYCIEPNFDIHDGHKRLVSVIVTSLLYYDKEFKAEVFKDGRIDMYFPDADLNEDSKHIFINRVERIINYVSVS